MPMWLWMSNVHPTALRPLPHKLIVKNGDDLRQDMLTLQMLTLFDKVSMSNIPYTGNIWQGKILTNHAGKSYWRGKIW